MLDNNDILKGSGKKIYSPRITKKQLKCVEMLIKGEQTRTDIAKELGISRDTLYKWMKKDEFQAALQKRTDEIKRQAIQYLDSKSLDAAHKLWEVAESDKDTRSKLEAVNSVLNRSLGKGNQNITIEDNRENKGFDLAGALAAIKADKEGE